MPFDPISIGLGLAGTLVGGIGKIASRNQSNKVMGKLLNEDPIYSENPIAKQRAALARNLMFARMPGAISAEKNIYRNTANAVGNIQRNATDASQAIAAASGAFAQGDQSFGQLQEREAQDFGNRYNRYDNAQEGVIREGDKVFNDQTRRFDNKVNINGAIQENKANNWGDIGNFGGSLMNFGMAGGFKGMFAKGGGNNAQGGDGQVSGGFSGRSMAARDLIGSPSRMSPRIYGGRSTDPYFQNSGQYQPQTYNRNWLGR